MNLNFRADIFITRQVSRKCLVFGWIVFLFFPLSITAQAPPAWLYNPPRDASHLYGVGIAPYYTSDSLTYVMARQHAVSELTKQYSTSVKSKLAESQHTGKVLSFGYTTETVDSSNFQRCAANAIVIDSARTTEYYYVLVSIGRNLGTPDASEVSLGEQAYPSGEEPAWITAVPESPGAIYGIGISKPYMEVPQAWEQSAKEARREIAMTLSARKSSLRKEQITDAGTYHRKWSEDVTNVTLHRNIIVGRWYDTDKHLYYTLIEYPLR
ncbi:MAG: LPP20 family lipoprotein [Candidatus Marinimicrobia bacterium]|nr:LPP20 family lipoprotein [Candidatus Neomarinimicrobiota bacterium]MCF7827722.1 LPP20 family lipoprotein [Candidatus Neomarinimicrobiota bacterium]MCF7881223.1 LPP20 family lipoprotein [Candidatus Neomarinimicrobiota bacterium]